MLAEKINNDLKEAMKNKDSFKLGVIRMIKGAMQLAKPNPMEESKENFKKIKSANQMMLDYFNKSFLPQLSGNNRQPTNNLKTT